MKKLTVGLAVLLSGYAANSLAALPTGASSRCDVSVPNFCGGFTFGLTGLYWRVSSPELDFGVSYPNNSFGFGSRLNATSNHLKHDYNWAWSANVGYIFPCSGNDVNLTYTHYDHTRRGEVRNDTFPTFLPLSQVNVSPLLTFGFPIESFAISGTGTSGVDAVTFEGLFANGDSFPATSLGVFIDPDDITRVYARSDFENNSWDLDFGQTINVGCNFRLRWFGGLRYTRLKHTFDVVTEAAPIVRYDQGITFSDNFTATVGTTLQSLAGTVSLSFIDGDAIIRDIVNQKSDFNGIGPRFGLTGDYHLSGGFGIVGSLSTSLLVGNVDSRLRSRIDLSINDLPVPEAEVTLTGVTITDLDPVVLAADFDATFVEFGVNHPDETRVVPNIDAKIGLDWTYQFCNCSHSKLTVEAGYMVSHYFNAIDRLSVLDVFAPEYRTRHTVDVSFDGPYIGVQVAL